ncbi:MAG: DUF2284 domain-containing protein [Clostridia bacterium]|nr:DUF2284 domain-containing protein [Clostridia bacterium]
MENINIIEKVKTIGIHESSVIDPKDILFLEEVRGLCKINSCGKYDTNWACPPAVGTVDECRSKCLQYDKALVFSTKYIQQDYYDFEEWGKARKLHDELTININELFKSEHPDSMTLSVGGCSLCNECTYPGGSCRLPGKMFPALEGYGVQVSDLAQKCGIKYHNGEGTITYFGAVFFNG